MNYGLYLEILLGCVPENYEIEDYEDSGKGNAFLLLSITHKKKYHVSLDFFTDKDTIGFLYMSEYSANDYKELDTEFLHISQYKIKELQAKVKEFICTEMEKFIK
tara:strand:+ start:3613 stop:3927 length:315 start_codon:yes stop_codon:yes gene_type:complete